MAAEQSVYEGRKGQRRLKAIEKYINRVNEEFDHNYTDSPEMRYLDEELEWIGTSRLIFVMAQRNVHFRWNGMRDYGYIRLCKSWIVGNERRQITADAMAAMIKDILPAEMCFELSDELAALEIS